jgi:hypothetical protein
MAFPIAGAFTKWPNGAGGDLTITQANEFIDFSQSSAPLNYRNLTINSGCTLWIRVTDGYPSLIGVAGNLTINGTIRIVDKFTDSSWPTSTTVSRTLPLLNLQVFSWTTPAARTGGGGGSKGFGVAGSGGNVRSPPTALGGAGGGYNTNGGNGQGTGDGGIGGSGGTSATSASNGASVADGFGLTGANGGGRNYNNGEFGGNGSGCGGGGGGGGWFSSFSGNKGCGGGGGSGGWPGRNGAALYLRVLGYISGSGTISAAGENGRSGFNGGNYGSISFGGNGGGGGAGGSGGNITIKYNSLTGVSTSVAAGSGGGGGSGGSVGVSGAAGFPGSAGSGGPNGSVGTTNISAA